MSTFSSWLILISICAFITALVASGAAAMIASNAAYKGDSIEAINAKFASDIFRIIIAGPVMLVAASLLMGFGAPLISSSTPPPSGLDSSGTPRNTNEQT